MKKNQSRPSRTVEHYSVRLLHIMK